MTPPLTYEFFITSPDAPVPTVSGLQLTTLESMVVLAAVIVQDPEYVDIDDSAALGPVLLGPGQQPPIPSGPSGICGVDVAHVPLEGGGVGVGVGVGGGGVGLGAGAVNCIALPPDAVESLTSLALAVSVPPSGSSPAKYPEAMVSTITSPTATTAALTLMATILFFVDVCQKETSFDGSFMRISEFLLLLPS